MRWCARPEKLVARVDWVAARVDLVKSVNVSSLHDQPSLLVSSIAIMKGSCNVDHQDHDQIAIRIRLTTVVMSSPPTCSADIGHKALCPISLENSLLSPS